MKGGSAVIGIMSGTSHDGADFALVEIAGSLAHPRTFRALLIRHLHRKYRKSLRETIRAAFTGDACLICRLNFELGEFYAKNVALLLQGSGYTVKDIDAVASHGQTVYHLPPSGGRSGSTLQLGESSVIAERTGITVVSDFRSRDMAAGGQGAPLVPLADYFLFAGKGAVKAVVNIGGIANVTILKEKKEDTVAFDIGPGNSLIDEAIVHLSKGERSFDRNGALAGQGRPDGRLLAWLLSHPFMRKRPPKSTDRQTFGAELVRQIFSRYHNLADRDVVSTLTHFSAEIICRAITPFRPDEVIVSGGGTENRYLMGLIAERLQSAGIPLKTTLQYGIPSQAKEAVSFAILGYLTLKGIPGNLPSATGARREVVLGKITVP